MTRISSFGQQALLLQNTLRNQERLAVTQEQITTGKKASEFRELSADVQAALNARQAQASVETFRSTIQGVRQTVDAYDVQLTSIVDSSRDLKQGILTAIGQEDATGFQSVLDQTFGLVASALNTRINGNFIFSGALTDRPPVNVSALSDLAGLATAADAFDNDQQVKRAAIAEGVEIEFGQLADDIALDIMASFKRIVDFNNGPDGPLTGKLTAPQRAFLETELANLESAIQKAQTAQVENGLKSTRLDVVDEQHASSEVFLASLVSDLEDVDLAEAITRLNQDQLALEASFRAIGTLSNLSLLNFL